MVLSPNTAWDTPCLFKCDGRRLLVQSFTVPYTAPRLDAACLSAMGAGILGDLSAATAPA